MRNNKKNVHVGGVLYGLSNVGDEAILESILNGFYNIDKYSVSASAFDENLEDDSWLQSRFPKVYVNPIRAIYKKPVFGFYAYSKREPFAFLRLKKERDFFLNKDLYICGGATILSDCPWYSLRTVMYALEKGVPTVLFGVGMASVVDPKTKDFIKGVCNELQDIFVRDQYVIERLVDLGVDREKLKISYDPALAVTPTENLDLTSYLSEDQLERYNDNNLNIAITISGEKDIKKNTPLGEIKNVIKYYREEYDANVFLVPTSLTCGGDVDMMQDLGVDEKCFFVHRQFTPSDLITFMKKMSFVLSSRLHMNILSSIGGTPSIGLVRNDKIVDYAKLLGLKYYSLREFDANGVIDYSKYLIENRESVSRSILSKVDEMKGQYEKAITYIKDKYLS